MSEKLRTFGDILKGDVLVDKTGKRWNVIAVDRTKMFITRLTIDADRTLRMEKPDMATVVIDRPMVGLDLPKTSKPVEPEEQTLGLEQAVAVISSELGGTVLAEVTDAQQAALDKARETGQVLSVQPFRTMSLMVKRTHLFLFHDVEFDDADTTKDLEAKHDDAHTREPRVAHAHRDV